MYQTLEETNQVLRQHYIAKFSRRFKVKAAEPGHGLGALPAAGGQSRQYGTV